MGEVSVYPPTPPRPLTHGLTHFLPLACFFPALVGVGQTPTHTGKSLAEAASSQPSQAAFCLFVSLPPLRSVLLTSWQVVPLAFYIPVPALDPELAKEYEHSQKIFLMGLKFFIEVKYTDHKMYPSNHFKVYNSHCCVTLITIQNFLGSRAS